MIFQSPTEIQAELSRRIRTRRLAANLSQDDLARKTGLARRSVQHLEAGGCSTVATLVRVLHALDLDCAAVVPPPPSVDPIAVFEGKKPRQRASRTVSKPQHP